MGVAPTLIRSLMRNGDVEVARYNLSMLRVTVSAGEVWTRAPWDWFFEHVCKKTLPFLNIVGGTEVGGCNFVGTLHGPLRPGSFDLRALGRAWRLSTISAGRWQMARSASWCSATPTSV